MIKNLIIKLSLEAENFDNPDNKETLNYTFEIKNGTFSENARKVSENLVRLARTTTISGTPLRDIAKAELELTDISKLENSLKGITFGADIKSTTPGS
jgi:hypothetical protein